MIILYTPITLHGTEYTRSQCTVGNQGHKGTIFCKKKKTNKSTQTNINQTNINHPHRLDYTYFKYEQHTVFKGSKEPPLKVKEQTQ